MEQTEEGKGEMQVQIYHPTWVIGYESSRWVAAC